MALTKFNKSVSALLAEHAEDILAAVEAAFKEKFDFDEEEVEDVFKEMREKFTKVVAEKKKRAPTAYNIYIKEKMAELKASHPEMKGKDLMKAATAEWTKTHPKEPKKAAKSATEDEAEPSAPSDAEMEAEPEEAPKKSSKKAAKEPAKEPAAKKGKGKKVPVAVPSEEDEE